MHHSRPRWNTNRLLSTNTQIWMTWNQFFRGLWHLMTGLHLYAIVVVMVKIMLLLQRLVTRHYSWLRTQIFVCKQFFQGSDHIRKWK